LEFWSFDSRIPQVRPRQGPGVPLRELPSKKIVMGSRSCQEKSEDLVVDFIDKKPVWFDMTLSVSRIGSCQRMISIFLRKRLPAAEQNQKLL
jgi:hypothetical protein